MAKDPKPTTGPHSWGNPPKPKPKGVIQKIIAKIAKVNGSNI